MDNGDENGTNEEDKQVISLTHQRITNISIDTLVLFVAPMHTFLPVLAGPGQLKKLRSRISPRSRSMVLTAPLRPRLPTGQHPPRLS